MKIKATKNNLHSYITVTGNWLSIALQLIHLGWTIRRLK